MTFEHDMTLAHSKLQSGQNKNALKAAKSAMQKNARSPFPPNFAGIALGGMGKHRQAVLQFKKALKLDPQFHDARKNLAQSLILLDEPGTAVKVLSKLTKLTPDNAGVWYLVAQANAKLGKPETAVDAATKAIDLAPDLARAYNIRALMRDEMGQYEDSLEDFYAALELNPNDIETLTNIGSRLAHLARYDEARKMSSRAVELAPGNTDARLQFAKQLVASGDFEEAIEQCHQVLKLDPKNSDAIQVLVTLQSPEQNKLLEQVARSSLRSQPKKSMARISLEFALSKIAEQAGRKEEADVFLSSANRQMAQNLPYDHKVENEKAERLFERFNTPIILPTVSSDAPRPIFVLGLPRSGTTLTEAILGAHPNVAPLGERMVSSILLKEFSQGNLPFDQSAIQEFVAKDQDLLPDLPENTIAYVDKLPDNYRLIGFLLTAYPQARIINLRRDPRDTALSMWRGYFSAGALPYTYDLRSMAHRFNFYARIMAHWHKILPGQIFDLRYEDMVSDIESTSRSLAHFCDLDWSAEMARPDQNVQQVLTLSATQIRQPVHKRSVGKWRQHETTLAPFIENLDPELWPEIRPEIA